MKHQPNKPRRFFWLLLANLQDRTMGIEYFEKGELPSSRLVDMTCMDRERMLVTVFLQWTGVSFLPHAVGSHSAC